MPTTLRIPTTLQIASVNSGKFKEKERILTWGDWVCDFLTSTQRYVSLGRRWARSSLVYKTKYWDHKQKVHISAIMSWCHKLGSWPNCFHWPRFLAKANQGLEGTLTSLLTAVLKETVYFYKHSLRYTPSSHTLANDIGNLARVVGESPWHWK